MAAMSLEGQKFSGQTTTGNATAKCELTVALTRGKCRRRLGRQNT